MGVWACSVLNALRHQRFGHRNQSHYRLLVLECAQRLTASEVWTYNVCYGKSQTPLCAQRLTASEVWTSLISQKQTAIATRAQRLTASEVWTCADGGDRF